MININMIIYTTSQKMMELRFIIINNVSIFWYYYNLRIYA